MPIDKILWPGKPATEEQIAAFEKVEGVTLPAGYREFLKTYNGGRPIPDAFRFGTEPGSLLNTFYELDEGEGETRDLQTACRRYRRRIPHTMIPIANDAGNNKILLGVHGEHYGRVYFLDHMDPRPIFEIAPSFEAFLDSFEPPPEVDLAHDWVERSGASGSEGTGEPNQPEERSPGKQTLTETVHVPHTPSAPANVPLGVAGPSASAGRTLAQPPLHGDVVGDLAPSNLEALGRRLGTQIQLDEYLRTDLEVVLHIDEASDLVSILVINAGRLALVADVLSQEKTIKLLQRYNEAWRQFHRRFDELKALLSGSIIVPPGSEAWNARMAAEKIRRIAGSRRRALVVHSPTSGLEQILSDEIAFLDEQSETFEAIVVEARG
jgi:SMI1 / KNR4 family (SUKH-1)